MVVTQEAEKKHHSNSFTDVALIEYSLHHLRQA
jgi:hypothetical protein